MCLHPCLGWGGGGVGLLNAARICLCHCTVDVWIGLIIIHAWIVIVECTHKADNKLNHKGIFLFSQAFLTVLIKCGDRKRRKGLRLSEECGLTTVHVILFWAESGLWRQKNSRFVEAPSAFKATT